MDQSVLLTKAFHDGKIKDEGIQLLYTQLYSRNGRGHHCHI